MPGGTRAEAAGIGFRLVGPFQVEMDGKAMELREVGSRKGRTLLKLLAVNRGHMVSTDRIADVVWEGTPPSKHEEHVAVLVSRLRRTFGPELIEGGRSGYRLTLMAGTDVDDAAALMDEATARIDAMEPALARVAADGALSILEAGGLLDDEPEAEWREGARAELERLRRRARLAAATAALALDDPGRAADLARNAIADDPLDEEAHRALMLALRAEGEPAAALAVFERLRTALMDELGADPAPQTRALHLAILRDERPPDPPRPAARAATWVPDPGFVGRDTELAELGRRWAEAATGRPSLIAIAGEAGIGKTRLAAEVASLATATGGLVVRSRCYEAERSLFLQPFVEAVRSVVVATDPEVVRDLAGDRAGTLGDLVPEVARILRPHRYSPAPPEMERRRAFEAMTWFLQRLTRRRPVLLLIDDLHNAGASSVELLHFLARRLGSEPMCILATIRSEEGQDVLEQLSDLADVLEVGPLSGSAVDRLARAMGAPELGPRVRALTRGHTLFAVEAIRALREGGDPDGEAVPETLRAAVLARLRRTDPRVEDVLRTACILGSAFDLPTTARLMDAQLEDVARWAEGALRARLITDVGTGYEFANDLIREVLYRTTPTPTRILRHRRAAELLTGNPEAVATHAAAGGAWELALGQWREAADRAARRYANRDAELLLDRALVAARTMDDRAGEAGVRLERGRARFALRDFEGARDDLDAALLLARASGLRWIEMQSLRELGGDLRVALGLPTRDCLPPLEAALTIARELDDRAAETSVLGRLSVVHGNCGRFDLAVETADLAVQRARDSGDERALALALDGRKMAAAHLGDFVVLERCVRELEGLLRRSGDIFLLQWAVLESAFEPMARARWDEAAARIGEALALNRQIADRSMESWFLSHLAWMERSRGDLDRSLGYGRQALDIAEEVGHAWCYPFAQTMVGWTLEERSETGRAVDHLRRGLEVAERSEAEFYLVRCLAHLAWSTWSLGETAEALELAARAETMIRAVRTPLGTAFLHGAHAYVALGRVLVASRELDRAEALIGPVLTAAEASDWKEAVADTALLTGRIMLARDDPDGGTRRLRQSLALAIEAGLPHAEAEASTALREAGLAPGTVEAG